MADAASDKPHEHLAGPRLGKLDLLHDERLAELAPELPRASACAHSSVSAIARRIPALKSVFQQPMLSAVTRVRLLAALTCAAVLAPAAGAASAKPIKQSPLAPRRDGD